MDTPEHDDTPELDHETAEMATERAHYQGLLHHNRQLQADYGRAMQLRWNQAYMLDQFMLKEYLDFIQQYDPAGRKAPDEVGRAIVAELTAKFKEPGLLRLSTNDQVRDLLAGLLDHLPPEPPVIMVPKLVPVPQNLRLKFES